MGVVDVFDAITEQRPYQEARPAAEGIQVLRDQVGRGWRRADLVEEFVTLIESGRIAV
jgi:response regulator RpfG family c-di-GMP phosphodiesterase